MKILVIVSFTENAQSLRNPSSYTGVWALVTEDESHLALDGKNMHWTPIGSELWRQMERAFFSEWRAEKFLMAKYPNKEYRLVSEVLAKHDHRSFDRIVFWEA